MVSSLPTTSTALDTTKEIIAIGSSNEIYLYIPVTQLNLKKKFEIAHTPASLHLERIGSTHFYLLFVGCVDGYFYQYLITDADAELNVTELVCYKLGKNPVHIYPFVFQNKYHYFLLADYLYLLKEEHSLFKIYPTTIKAPQAICFNSLLSDYFTFYLYRDKRIELYTIQNLEANFSSLSHANYLKLYLKSEADMIRHNASLLRSLSSISSASSSLLSPVSTNNEFDFDFVKQECGTIRDCIPIVDKGFYATILTNVLYQNKETNTQYTTSLLSVYKSPMLSYSKYFEPNETLLSITSSSTNSREKHMEYSLLFLFDF